MSTVRAASGNATPSARNLFYPTEDLLERAPSVQ